MTLATWVLPSLSRTTRPPLQLIATVREDPNYSDALGYHVEPR